MTTDQLNALKARIEARKAKAAANKAAPATVTPIRPVLSPSACRPEPARTGLDVITPGVRFLRRNAYVAAVLYVPTHELTVAPSPLFSNWLTTPCRPPFCSRMLFTTDTIPAPTMPPSNPSNMPMCLSLQHQR